MKNGPEAHIRLGALQVYAPTQNCAFYVCYNHF